MFHNVKELKRNYGMIIYNNNYNSASVDDANIGANSMASIISASDVCIANSEDSTSNIDEIKRYNKKRPKQQ